MKASARDGTPSFSSSSHSSSRNHFVEPPSLVDRSWNYLARKTGAVTDDGDVLPGASSLSRSWPSQRRGSAAASWRIWSVPNLLTLAWLLLLWWGEHGVFSSSVRRCDWESWEKWPAGAQPHRLILVADPQLVDPHTYPGRPWPLSSFTVHHTDLYLRRAFSRMQRILHPDTVFFLGDLFDGGREWSTAESTSPEERWRPYGGKFWLKEYERWSRIFVRHWNDGGASAGRGQRGRKLIASLPGNHDLGFAKGIQVPVRKRFQAYFGEGNRVDVIGNHTFVSVDSVSLSAKDQAGGGGGGLDPAAAEAIWKPTEDFLSQVPAIKRRAVRQELRHQAGHIGPAVKHPHELLNLADPDAVALANQQLSERLQQEEKEADEDLVALTSSASTTSLFPTILLTHVPLYRPPDTSCGPQREQRRDHRNAILIHGGYQYQNVLTPDLSKFILDQVSGGSSGGNGEKTDEIIHAFSGDDHDYCDIRHSSAFGGLHEITVKSISWAMGIRRPGFLLVSLWNPISSTSSSTSSSSPQSSIQTHLCLLPNQLSIFTHLYGLFALLTLLILFLSLLLPPFPPLPHPSSDKKSRRTTTTRRLLLLLHVVPWRYTLGAMKSCLLRLFVVSTVWYCLLWRF